MVYFKKRGFRADRLSGTPLPESKEVKMKLLILSATCFTLLLVGTTTATAATVDIEVTNTTHDIYFTPLLITAHPATDHLFQPGVAATASLQAMAEGGDIDALLIDVGGADADTVGNPAAGLLAPGQTATATLVTAAGSTQLSLVGMLLPTNDGFVGLDSLTIPTTPGTYVYQLNGYDAGTEVNDELINTVNGGVPGIPGIPADPSGAAGTGGTGVAASETNPVVHIHRGNLGDSDPAGGASDLDSTEHRWLNPVAQLRLTVQ